MTHGTALATHISQDLAYSGTTLFLTNIGNDMPETGGIQIVRIKIL
jgi:hypothetical protein